MGKRKRVPVKLHSELTEYSSLLRALRTTSTLDVASHIATHELPSSVHANNPESSNSRNITPEVDTAVDPDSSSALQQKRTRTTSPALSEQSSKSHNRDLWTRWPLLADDVPIPEWSLEDEIQHLMNGMNTGDGQNKTSSDPSSRQSSTEPDDAPYYLPYIALSTLDHLHTILGAIAVHTPYRSDSLQNRLEPIRWQSVLDALAASGADTLFDESVMSSVQARMQTMYSSQPSHSEHADECQASSRVDSSFKSEASLSQALSRHGGQIESLFSLAPRPVMPKSGRGKRRKAS